MKYFDHDTDASSDDKVLALRVACGGAAVDAYWATVETLYRTGSELEATRKQPAFVKLIVTLCTDETTLIGWLDTMASVGLLDCREDENGTHFYSSERAEKNIERYQSRCKTARQNGKKPKQKRTASESLPNRLQAGSENEASRGEKEKEKEKETTYVVPPIAPQNAEGEYGLLCLKALNDVLGTAYSQLPSKSARCLDRMDGRYSIDEVKAMIECKRDEWQGTRFASNLTPNTLFSPDHFEQYIHQSKATKEVDDEWQQYA